MKKITYLLAAFALLTLTAGVSINPDNNKFLDVKSWKGTITIKFNGSKETSTHDSGGETSSKFSFQHTIQCSFQTGTGNELMTDIFTTGTDYADQRKSQEEMVKDMQSGKTIDVEKIMQMYGQMGTDKYKLWASSSLFSGLGEEAKEEAKVAYGEESKVSYHVNDKLVTKRPEGGEGGLYCVINETHTWTKGGSNNELFFQILVNIPKNVYHFNVEWNNSCEAEHNAVFNIDVKNPGLVKNSSDCDEKAPVKELVGYGVKGLGGSNKYGFTDIPLPASGMALSGKKVIKDFYTFDSKPLDVEFEWNFSPAD
ncbi:MAG: hypothetical protein IIA88_00360 [Bacteroidetes bacterium]|nr:hypothetical protein [Bacteroidota bacterium]